MDSFHARRRIENLLEQLGLGRVETAELLRDVAASLDPHTCSRFTAELGAARAQLSRAGHVVVDGWIAPAAAAYLLGKSDEGLRQARCRGRGPVATKIGGAILYRLADVVAEMSSCHTL